MNMKKLLSALLTFMFLFTTASRADEYTYLTVTEGEGTSDFQISQIEKISFDQADMIVTLANGSEERLPLSGVSKMFFSDGKQSIAKVSTDGSKIRLEDGVLKVQVEEGEMVRLYNLKGEEILSAKQSIAYDIRHLTKGVYIVRVGNESKKLMTR